MPRDPYDLDMPGPGDIWSQHTPFDDEVICECGDEECEGCDDDLEAAHIDDKIDEMRDREIFDD